MLHDFLIGNDCLIPPLYNSPFMAIKLKLVNCHDLVRVPGAVNLHPSPTELFEAAVSFLFHVFQAYFSKLLLEPACYNHAEEGFPEPSGFNCVGFSDFKLVLVYPPGLRFPPGENQFNMVLFEQ